jgi:hypothetical protein
MRKYADVEKTKVLEPEDQRRIAGNLHNMGKTSAVNLTDEQRRKLDSGVQK